MLECQKNETPNIVKPKHVHRACRFTCLYVHLLFSYSLDLPPSA